ncbi:MAG: hypothetical protein HC814_04125 [Rhodobacteraceae bacterium]|nr:hypothetical protein [Paracoccaceae bacterium]
MSGVDDRPLLVLNRVDEGRVALLASDHAWLWNRGYEGGGPQLELLRRLAHWMMKEPELEEEALNAIATGQTMRIQRRTLEDTVPSVTITDPAGTITELPLSETAPGIFEGTFEGPEIGLYHLQNGDQTAVIGLGPAAPREFVKTIATGEVLEPVLASVRGGTHRLETGLPRLREVREGRPAAGRGWIGLTSRNAYETRDLRQTTLLPGWLVLLLSSLLIVGAWLREGRR